MSSLICCLLTSHSAPPWSFSARSSTAQSMTAASYSSGDIPDIYTSAALPRRDHSQRERGASCNFQIHKSKISKRLRDMPKAAASAAAPAAWDNIEENEEPNYMDPGQSGNRHYWKRVRRERHPSERGSRQRQRAQKSGKPVRSHANGKKQTNTLSFVSCFLMEFYVKPNRLRQLNSFFFGKSVGLSFNLMLPKSFIFVKSAF